MPTQQEAQDSGAVLYGVTLDNTRLWRWTGASLKLYAVAAGTNGVDAVLFVSCRLCIVRLASEGFIPNPLSGSLQCLWNPLWDCRTSSVPTLSPNLDYATGSVIPACIQLTTE